MRFLNRKHTKFKSSSPIKTFFDGQNK
ncbi:hypothetical protein Ocin01_03229 [Orchesella cincta]|uniref:Uncharacterized protein n=1 Tax=Orchesella cincta TaxID=48709 RepID=A0A1D2NDV3_ORCCI|nr:hypothetical protein Ocin01_03229 [Orchesella cincta]